MIAFAGRCWCPEVGLGIMFPVPIVVLPSLAVLRVQKFVRQKMNEKPPRGCPERAEERSRRSIGYKGGVCGGGRNGTKRTAAEREVAR